MQNVIRLAISQILTMESRLPTQYSIIIYFSNMDTFMQFFLLTYTHTRHLHICLCDIISLQSIFHQPTPLGETVTTGQELELPLCAGQSFGWKFMTVPWETIPDCFVGKNVGSVVSEEVFVTPPPVTPHLLSQPLPNHSQHIPTTTPKPLNSKIHVCFHSFLATAFPESHPFRTFFCQWSF